MAWPSFLPVTLETTAAVSDIALKVTFADYTSFESRLAWQNAIALTPQDVGFYSLLFDAESLKSEFKTISGSASYLRRARARNKTSPSLFRRAVAGHLVDQRPCRRPQRPGGLSLARENGGAIPQNYDSGPCRPPPAPSNCNTTSDINKRTALC